MLLPSPLACQPHAQDFRRDRICQPVSAAPQQAHAEPIQGDWGFHRDFLPHTLDEIEPNVNDAYLLHSKS
jgi:hypothetical protein